LGEPIPVSPPPPPGWLSRVQSHPPLDSAVLERASVRTQGASQRKLHTRGGMGHCQGAGTPRAQGNAPGANGAAGQPPRLPQ
jgi:hypothetical protein